MLLIKLVKWYANNSDTKPYHGMTGIQLASEKNSKRDLLVKTKQREEP